MKEEVIPAADAAVLPELQTGSGILLGRTALDPNRFSIEPIDIPITLSNRLRLIMEQVKVSASMDAN
ncbi:MAG: hypothetical protein A3I66_04310 [Burkholderiales bacterium RIFCSPLOWO2_02_FULL_57_36]|nr:MAG: hypothetical protein A3I66_04310 [Burkholderiales bacterium RIFCSPLOWO2_02_FULL_57_36]